MKTHYVYKIINDCPTDQRKYYIGVRSTHHQDPNNDTNYRSSSKHLKQALKEIGHKNFSKEILSVWETRELANDEEIRLHELYDVARNPEYYNKAKAHSKRFCTEGMTTVKNILTGENEFVTVEEARDKSKYQPLYYDTVNAIDIITGEKVKVTKEEYRENPNLRHTVKGTITVVDLETGIRRQVTVEEFNNNPNLVGQQIGKVNVVDTRTGKRYSVTKEDFEKYDYYEQVTKGTITVIDVNDGLTKKVSIKEYHNNDNYKSIQAKCVGVFDENDNVVLKSYDNFKKFCVERKMPYNAFAKSLQQNGKPLYENVYSNQSRLEKAGYWKFKGWYAKEIS